MGSNYNLIQYPDDSIDSITHGSYIEIDLNGKRRSFYIGTHRLPGLETIDGVESISSDSPLGSVLMGSREGDSIEWRLPNGRIMNAIIIIIDQNRMKGYYEQ